MDKTVKWILIAVLIIVVIAILIYIFQSKQTENVSPGPPVQQQQGNAIQNILSGLFGSAWIQNLFGGPKMGTPGCQASNPGFDNNGYYTRACGGVPGGGGGNCNPDNPGKDMNGFISSQCGG